MAKSTTRSKPPSSKSKSASKPPESMPPSTVAGSGGGSSAYAIGAVVLGVAAVGLLYMKCSQTDDKPAPTTQTTATAKPPQPPPELPEFSPPPPPEEEPDAGADAGKPVAAAKSNGKASSGNGSGGICAACGQGEASSALTTAVAGTAGLARGCYQRALRTGGGEGRITVSVSVGADGNLCGARVTEDSVGNPAITSCVVSKFQKSYPKPNRGCVVVNVPINFKMKTD